MDGDFYVAASLATTLTKVALRYVAIVQDKKKHNVCQPFPSLMKDPFHHFACWLCLLIGTLLLFLVICCRIYADHGHCAAPGKVLSA